MDEEAAGAPDEDAAPPVGDHLDVTAPAPPPGPPDDDPASAAEEESAASEIIDLPWDDDLPVALGEETDALDVEDGELAEDGPEEEHPDGEAADTQEDALGQDDVEDIDDGRDMGQLDDDPVGGRRNSLPRRVDSWRSRSATGAIATAIAMGLQQVFEPERRRPAAVAEAPSDPYDDDDPITVDYVPDDAEATTVHVKPWLLQKGE